MIFREDPANPFEKPQSPMKTTNPCPFKVGDRIHELRCKPVYSHQSIKAPWVEAVAGELEFELDPIKPDATVTAITPLGFEYKYDCRVPIGRAQWGTYTEGGECYVDGFIYWRKV